MPRSLSQLIEGGTLLLSLGLYFWFVFGYVSRRFERQADVYGSKVVSCELPDCPPHTDLDNELAPEPAAGSATWPLPGGNPDFCRRLGKRRPLATASTARTAPGGTDPSPTGLRSSRAWNDIRNANTASSAAFAACVWALGLILAAAVASFPPSARSGNLFP